MDEIESAEFDAVVAAGVVTPGQVKPNAFDEILRWIKPGESIMYHEIPIFPGPSGMKKINFFML